MIIRASRGKGGAAAIEFGKEGASVVVNYEKAADKAAEVANQVKAYGSKAIAVKANVVFPRHVGRVYLCASPEFDCVTETY